MNTLRSAIVPTLAADPSTAAIWRSVWVIWPAAQPTKGSATVSAQAQQAMMRAVTLRGTRMVESYLTGCYGTCGTCPRRDGDQLRNAVHSGVTVSCAAPSCLVCGPCLIL